MAKSKKANPLKGFYPGCSVKLRNGDVVKNVYKTAWGDSWALVAARSDIDIEDLRKATCEVRKTELVVYTRQLAMSWCASGSYTGELDHDRDIVGVVPKATKPKPAKPKPRQLTDLIEGYYDGCSVELKDGTVVPNVWHTKCDSCYALTAFKKQPTKQDIARPDDSGNVQVIDCEDMSWHACGQMWSYQQTDHDIKRVIPAVAVKPKEDTSSLSAKVRELEDELAKVKAQLAEREKCIKDFIEALNDD